MHVYVTGATGVLGHRLVEELAAMGHDVTGLVRDDAGAATVEERGGEPRRGDVLELETLGAAREADVAVHAATAIPTSDKPDGDEWKRNDRIRREGAANLVEAAGDDIEAIYFPSVVWLVAPSDRDGPPEDATLEPDRATRSAADTERYLAEAGDRHGFDVGVLRNGFFYAPDAAHTRQFARELLAGDLPVVGGGLLGRRDADLSFVHADDAARALALAVDQRGTGTYHVVDDETVTARNYLARFAELLDAPEPGRVPGWLARWFVGNEAVAMLTEPMPASNATIKRELDWEPRHPSYRDGLRSVVDAWLEDDVLVATDDGYTWQGDI